MIIPVSQFGVHRWIYRNENNVTVMLGAKPTRCSF